MSAATFGIREMSAGGFRAFYRAAPGFAEVRSARCETRDQAAGWLRTNLPAYGVEVSEEYREKPDASVGPSPSPWKVLRANEGTSGPLFEAEAEEMFPFRRVVDANGKTVVACHDLATISEPDARLIEAAPDLLEAAEAVRDRAQANDGAGLLVALDVLERAIDRARGRVQA